MQEIMGTCGPVDRVLDSKSEGLGFDSHCWSCVVVSYKLLIPHCLCPTSDGYLVEHKLENVNGISYRKCAEFSPEEIRPYMRKFQHKGCNLWSLLNSHGYQTINIHIYIFFPMFHRCPSSGLSAVYLSVIALF